MDISTFCLNISTTRFAGYDTWSREAWRVSLIAAELGVVLDDETMVLSDVRDLQALRGKLQRLLDTNSIQFRR